MVKEIRGEKMIEIERAEATVFGEGNQQWETFLVVGSYKEASEQLAKLINDNDAIGDFFRVVENSREPKPLAQYLDEYIEHEIKIGNIDKFVTAGHAILLGNSWAWLLKQALNAYESTEQVKIRIERV